MDGLVAAFVAALIALSTDRAPHLAAVLSDRSGTPLRVLAAFTIVHATGFAVAAAGGAFVAPILNPNAKALTVGLALVSAAVAMVWREPKLDRLDDWRIGTFLTSLLGSAVLALGDRTQFLVFALSARSSSPALTAAGALAGAVLVTAIAVHAGEAAWRSVAWRWIRLGGGVLLGLTGIVFALSAWRLI